MEASNEEYKQFSAKFDNKKYQSISNMCEYDGAGGYMKPIYQFEMYCSTDSTFKYEFNQKPPENGFDDVQNGKIYEKECIKSIVKYTAHVKKGYASDTTAWIGVEKFYTPLGYKVTNELFGDWNLLPRLNYVPTTAMWYSLKKGSSQMSVATDTIVNLDGDGIYRISGMENTPDALKEISKSMTPEIGSDGSMSVNFSDMKDKDKTKSSKKNSNGHKVNWSFIENYVEHEIFDGFKSRMVELFFKKM